MKKESMSIALFALTICFQAQLCAGGAETEILLLSGKKAGGELLAVREHSLLLSPWKDATDEQLRTSNAVLLEISTAAIQSVTLKGEGGGHAAIGADAGGVFGGGMGFLISRTSQDAKDPVGEMVEETFSPVIIVSCALLGAGLGALVGASSRADKTVEASAADPDFSSLIEYARFQNGEPEFLKNRATKMIGQ